MPLEKLPPPPRKRKPLPSVGRPAPKYGVAATDRRQAVKAKKRAVNLGSYQATRPAPTVTRRQQFPVLTQDQFHRLRPAGDYRAYLQFVFNQRGGGIPGYIQPVPRWRMQTTGESPGPTSTRVLPPGARAKPNLVRATNPQVWALPQWFDWLEKQQPAAAPTPQRPESAPGQPPQAVTRTERGIRFGVPVQATPPGKSSIEEFFTKTLPGGVGTATDFLTRNAPTVYAGAPLGEAAAGTFTGKRGQRSGLGEGATLSGLPLLTFTQFAQSMMGVPGGLYLLATDPVGTARKMGVAIREDFQHPLQNPGYLAMDVWAALGLGAGAAGKLGAAAKAGSVGEAAARLVRPLDAGLRELAPGALTLEARNPLPRAISAGMRKLNLSPDLTRKIARERQWNRTIIADIKTAKAAALRYRGGRKVTGKSRVTPAEGEAVRAVANQTPLDVRLAKYREMLAQETRISRRRRLNQRIAAAEDAAQRGLLEVVTPDSPRYAEVGRLLGLDEAQIAERAAAGHPLVAPTGEFVSLERLAASSSKRLQELKIQAGELAPEQAVARIDQPGLAFRAGSASPQMKIGELPRPTVARRPKTSPQMTVGGAPRAMTLDEVRARYAEVSKTAEKLWESMYESLRDALYGSGKGASTEQALRNRYGSKRKKMGRDTVTESVNKEVAKRWKGIREYEGTNPQILAARDLIREDALLGEILGYEDAAAGARFMGEEVPARPPMPVAEGARVSVESPAAAVGPGAAPGLYYTPGGMPRSPALGPLRIGGKTFGVPKYPFSKRKYTGAGDVLGLTDPNAIKSIAEAELAGHRYTARIAAWKQAISESVSPSELVDRIDTGVLSPNEVASHWKGIRLKPGTTQPETRMLMENLLRGDNALSMDDLRVLAADADAQARVRFFDNNLVGMKTASMAGKSRVLNAIDATTQLAKINMLFTKGTGYIIPNLAGQAGMMAIHAPLRHFLDTITLRSTRILRSLTPEELATLRAASGQGIVRSTIIESGPSQLVNRAYSAAAGAYGKILDQPFRDRVFLVEAWNKGYTTKAEVKRLLAAADTLDETKSLAQWAKPERDLVEIRMRTDEALGRFQRMSDVEREVVMRVVLFWPWLRASGRYTMRLPVEHPVKTGGLMQLGRQGEEKARQWLGDLADLLPGVFVTGMTKAGLPRVSDPMSAALMSSPAEAYNLVMNEIGQGKGDTHLGEFASPAVSAFLAAFGYDAFRGRKLEGPIQDRLAQSAQGISPYPGLIDRLRHPGVQPHKLYGYSKRDALARTFLGSPATRTLNPEVAEKILKAAQGPVKPEVTARTEVALARKVGLPPDAVREIDKAWKLKIDVEERVKDADTYSERAHIVGAYFVGLHHDARQIVEDQLKAARSEREFQSLYDDMRDELFSGVLGDWHAIMNDYLEQEPAATG